MRPLLLGFGGVLGWAAWRNAPPMPHAAAAAWVLLVLLAIGGAWLAGARRGGGATAVATATATATAAASAEGGRAQQVLVVNVGDGARASAARGRHRGLDSAEWMGGPAVTADRLDDDAVASMLEDVAEREPAWRAGGDEPTA